MKKVLAALLASAVIMLAGCSSGNSTSVASVTGAGGESVSETQSAANAVTLAETEIYDANGIKITATGLKEGGILGPELALLIQNDSAQNIVVQPDYCVVNGYMMTDLMSANVAAGKKSNDTLTFMTSELKTCGITQIAEIRIRLAIIDGATYQTLYKTDEVTLLTSAAGAYTQTYDDSGEEIYNSNGIRVIAKNAGDEFLGKGVTFYLENTTGQAVAVSGEDISVNGFMVTDLFYADLAPHSHAVDTLTLLQSDLEDNSIDTIEEVELTLRIVDPETFMTMDSTAPITLHF